MRRKDPNITKHTLHLRKGDYETLRDRYPNSGAAKIIREIVARHVDRISVPLTPSDLASLGAPDDE